ncbi:type IV toxin-antitoxin system AbiEi family antitoxin, partial [Ornithobacterium rhinotracheale]
VFPVKRFITEELWTLHKTQNGYVKVSTPEVTALDLLIYENEIGGLNRATEVIQELCAEMDLKKMSNTLISQFPIASIQRLGYILSILEEKELEEIVWEKAQEIGLKFWKTP